MAISPFETKRYERIMKKFIDARRPPPHVRHELDLGYRLSGQSIEIFEIRPVLRGVPSEKMEHPVPKATYVKYRDIWKVFWQRADLAKELAQLEKSFAAWRAGSMEAFELSRCIHEFHEGASRDLYKFYSSGPSSLAVASAIANGIVNESEVSADLWEVLAEQVEYFRTGDRG